MTPPIPFNALVAAFAPLLGFLLGETFSKADGAIQETAWFLRQLGIRQYLVKRLLDLTHHWQYGVILMLLAYPEAGLFPAFQAWLWLLGSGLVASDIRDLENLKRRYSNAFKG